VYLANEQLTIAYACFFSVKDGLEKIALRKQAMEAVKKPPLFEPVVFHLLLESTKRVWRV
jgi:hypothetical protein